MSAVKKSSPKFSPAEARALFDKADAAGKAAAEARVPKPMVVQQVEGFGAAAVVLKTYEPVMDGVCGFAWVVVKPANSSFAKYLKESRGARLAYGGGMQVWVSAYNQSMEKKEAYAYAFADVLNEAGVDAYAQSRMD